MSLSTRALKARVRPSPADSPPYTTRETYDRATKPGRPPPAPVVGQFSLSLSLSLSPSPAPPARVARSWRVRPEPESRSRRRSTQRCPAGLETRDRLACGQVDIPHRRITCRWRRATTSTHGLTSLIAMRRTSYPSPPRRRSGWPGRCRRSGEPGAYTGHTQRVAQIALVVTNQSRQFNEYQARTLLICAMRSILPAMLGAFRTSTRPRAPLGHARSREARSRWRAGCRGGWSIRYATSRYPDRLPRGWIPARPRRRAPQSRGRPRARGYRW